MYLHMLLHLQTWQLSHTTSYMLACYPVELFCCLLVHGMSDNIYVKYPYLSAQEHQYFNWKCVVCNGEAQSPLKLEE